MQIRKIHIKNFQSIKELNITDIDRALIVVGKNSTGKTVILNALLAVAGIYQIKSADFNEHDSNIEITITLTIEDADLEQMNQSGIISKYKRYDIWLKDIKNKLPSLIDGKLTFTYIVNKNGKARYHDGVKKNNNYIIELFPKIHYIDYSRSVDGIQRDIFMAQQEKELEGLREKTCMFDKSRTCTNCFQCIGLIEKKKTAELSIYETAKLLQYKMNHLNIDAFIERLNMHFHHNSNLGQDISYHVNFNTDELFNPQTVIRHKEQGREGYFQTMSAGIRSIYILSLLEAYIEEKNSIPFIVVMEDPEIYLHPQLQKAASEILYRLSKKNQVIFSTHSPNLIFNFNSKQIRQVVLDENKYTTVNANSDIDEILNDLGYSANDLMNVSFVFIVEGKQDSNRLPILLKKYFSETYDKDGKLQRVAIIATNSCTNIKTYANLKYINKLYLKDQFLMIRDGDGKNPQELKNQLCSYYKQRSKYDVGNLPRVTEQNVLILKYYSFENYFLDPVVMQKIRVIKSEEDFYEILTTKFKEYLFKLSSVKKMKVKTGVVIHTKQDIKDNIELIKTYVRGHNLYDIFYGRYKGEKETRILEQYIEIAPKETFDDILSAINHFVFFESKESLKNNLQI